jgi:hypothetical protein
VEEFSPAIAKLSAQPAYLILHGRLFASSRLSGKSGAQFTTKTRRREESQSVTHAVS